MKRLALLLLFVASPLAAQHAKRDSTLALTAQQIADTIARDKGRPSYVERARLWTLALRDSLRTSRPDTVRITTTRVDTLVRVDTIYATAPAGIAVQPGQSIQAAVDANPPGTTFLLKAGTHVRQTVVPKDGDVFQGEAGTILDGQNATQFAFKGYTGARWVNGVTLRNLRVVHYAPPAQNGAIWGGDSPSASGSGWVLDSVAADSNANLGIRVGNRMQVLRSYARHNSTINIGGAANGVLVDGSEFSYGNEGCKNDPGFESGGSKFTSSDSTIVRNSFFHHNCGPGLWLDINNIHYLLENNRSEDNAREGIVTEISYQGVIRYNSVKRNGNGDPYRTPGWGWNAGIGIHASPDVEVYGNTVEANFNGIMCVQQARGSGTYGPYVVKNLYVHDNTILQTTVVPSGWQDGAAGCVRDVTTIDLFSATANNRFRNNAYTIGPTRTRPFAWSDNWRTRAEWQGYGNDQTGTFNP